MGIGTEPGVPRPRSAAEAKRGPLTAACCWNTTQEKQREFT